MTDKFTNERDPESVHRRVEKLADQTSDLSETLEKMDKKLMEAAGTEIPDAS